MQSVLCVSVLRSLPRVTSTLVVLVTAANPEAGFVAPAWRAVEPLTHAPENVQSPRIRRVGVIDDAIFECKRAHAGCLANVSRPVRADAGGDFRSGFRYRFV